MVNIVVMVGGLHLNSAASIGGAAPRQKSFPAEAMPQKKKKNGTTDP